MNPSLAKLLRLVNDAYEALEPLNDLATRPWRDLLFEECLLEERRHRTFVGGYYTITPRQAARFFAVKTLSAFVLNPETMPTVADYLYKNRSLYIAASLVLNYSEIITAALADFPISDFTLIQYVDFTIGSHP